MSSLQRKLFRLSGNLLICRVFTAEISAVAKQAGPFAALGGYVRRARERKAVTQVDISKQTGIRTAQLSALENGHNVAIGYYDQVAKALGYRGALELFTSGGDEQTRKLLRFWRALPDDEARNDVLRQLKDWIVRDEG